MDINIALFFMAFFTPYLGQIALRFQSFEFFWLTLFGVLICGNLTAPEDPLKGWISGFLGLSMVRVVVKVLHVPTSILMPIILIFKPCLTAAASTPAPARNFRKCSDGHSQPPS